MTDEVLFEILSGNEGDIGLITLNRPAVLNSLNHFMIKSMHKQLQIWATSPQIKAVIIRAVEGRAFCAGGDLRFTYQYFKEKDLTAGDFFRDEYELNKCIFHFPKPYIAFLDGITMGGGVGISIHGSHRIGTDKLVFAMPETGIGFFPDVGGTYFLPRCSGYLGYYLGLLGAKLTSDDCLALNLIQTKVSSEKLPRLLDALLKASFGKDANTTVTNIINGFKCHAEISILLKEKSEIDECFSKASMEEIVTALQYAQQSVCVSAALAIKKKSPTSLKVTHQALKQGKQLNFDECMAEEYRLACHFIQGHDFAEGIRATIIDKDHQPQWQPATLDGVTDRMVESYFREK